MNVLVTGGAGYIGSHTANRLRAAGHVPIVLDNLLYGHAWAVQWGPFEEGDLGDVTFLRDVFARHVIDAVVHFAANAYVGESMSEPRKYFRNNTGQGYCMFVVAPKVEKFRKTFAAKRRKVPA